MTIIDRGCKPGSAENDDPLRAWTQHMKRGEWERAWAVTDREMPRRAREPCTQWPRHLQYVWKGQPLGGKRVLVRCYHGLGDTIQFIRYMPLLKAVAGEVIVWVQPSLMSLLDGFEGVDRIVALHDGTVEVDYDVDIELMELPHIFRTTLATVPAKLPYLHADPMALPPMPQAANVGLVWKGGDWDSDRSIPYPLLAPFGALRGVNLFILQPWAREAGWGGDLGHFLGEFGIADYARALRAMDLLVTIDSMPAHLGGALGVPTWTLLDANADWRWMEDRDDSPWYPGMRLFRQPRAGDWAAVIAKVADELRQSTGSLPARRS